MTLLTTAEIEAGLELAKKARKLPRDPMELIATDADRGRFMYLAANHYESLAAEVLALRKAVKPLVDIADAYDDNALDDEARKVWGQNHEYHNTTPPERIELYSGRGGRELLTLAHCLAARTALSGATP